MNEVRAFVGHSFTQGDNDIVSSFLTYFQQISKLHPAFTWDHAIASEPRDLSEKVLSLIADKNVFIGICTKKERVATDKDFSALLLKPNYNSIPKDKLLWKTSDWVIQEIGLAIGRGMSLILLVEDGVRPPGGLQGNIEYIPFRRASPADCFGKLLEMIHSLSPEPTSAVTATREITGLESTSAEHLSAEPTTAPPPRTPTAEWSRSDYRTAFFLKILEQDDAGAAEINEAYLRTSDATEGDNRAEWQAEAEWAKIILDHGGSLARLRELATQEPKNWNIHSYLGAALAKFGEPLEAADVHETAATLAADPTAILGQLCEAAVQRAKGHRIDLARETLRRAKDLVIDDAGRDRILRTMYEFATISKDDDLSTQALEGIVELHPEEIIHRFTLAYKYSDSGNDDLALYHYLKIPPGERDALAWNNLGVALQDFGMPGKAVVAYRRAAHLRETLALSNLAHKFMEVGFFEEAEAEFNRALKLENFHKNVGQGLATLKSAPELEDRKESEALEAVAQKAGFYRLLGRAVSAPDCAPIGTWEGPMCALSITVADGVFRATGHHDRKSAFASILGNEGNPERQYIEYEGRIVGRRIEGSIKRSSDTDGKAPKSLLTLPADGDAAKFLMVLDETGGRLEVMESIRARKPKLYRLRKLS